MKQLLLVLALLLTGRASADTGNTIPPPSPHHAYAPPALRAMLAREAERSPSGEDPEMASDRRARLLQLLRAPHNTDLQPDKDFKRIRTLLPDAFDSAQAAYAAALTDFLLDPTFSCRHPVVSRYMQKRYIPGEPTSNCTSDVPFNVLSRHGEPRLTQIDPRRVRAIHLLFAGASRTLASRFGHVSLRLVVCPSVNSTDAECDINLEQHVVLGYRAHIDEMTLSLRKSITGGYEAHFYASSFLDVYQEYAIDEFRDIESLPLKVEEARRQAMVRELAELHFRVAIPYRYMTKNCATLLQNTLRMIWPELVNDKSAQWFYLRPDSFFNAMKKLSLTDSQALSDPASAESGGYFFPSTKPYYERAASIVSVATSQPAFTDLQGFLQIDPRQRHRQRRADFAFMENLAANENLREAQVILEEYAMMKSERLLLASVAEYFASHDIRQLLTTTRQRIPSGDMEIFDECLVKPISSRAKPFLSAKGIPAAQQAHVHSEEAETCKSQRAAEALRSVLHDLFMQNADAATRIWNLADYHAQSVANVQELLEMTKPPSSQKK